MVDHSILSTKLKSRNTCKHLWLWIQSFLERRSQQVKLPGVLSASKACLYIYNLWHIYIYITCGRVGLVVRALAFHQCGPGSISAPGVIRGLSLLVLYSAMRGFPPGTPVFPSRQKPTFDLICRKDGCKLVI